MHINQGFFGYMMMKSVDREKTCPLLLRMFCRLNGHHHMDEYTGRKTPDTADELIVYTWRDASLKELAGLIKEVYGDSRKGGVRFTFRHVYPDGHYRWVFKDIGCFVNGRSGRDDLKTMQDFRFVTGDYLDVAIYTADDRAHEANHMHSSIYQRHDRGPHYRR